MWLRLTRPDGHEGVVWITRRLLQAFLPRCYDLIRAWEPHDQPNWHASMVQPFVAKGGDATPARSQGAHAQPKAQGLCSSLNCERGPDYLSLSFSLPQQTIGLRCNIQETHCLLELLWQKQAEAAWGIEAPWISAPTI